MKKQSKEMVVYLLSRNDLKSMTHGKEVAHSHHAGVQMIAKYNNHKDVKEYINQGLKGNADHFNTTITLETDILNLKLIVEKAKKLGYVADVVIDPTYPFWIDCEVADAYKIPHLSKWKNDTVLVTRTELTFGWLLGDKNDETFRNLVDSLQLKSHNRLIYEEK